MTSGHLETAGLRDKATRDVKGANEKTQYWEAHLQAQTARGEKLVKEIELLKERLDWMESEVEGCREVEDELDRVGEELAGCKATVSELEEQARLQS